MELPKKTARREIEKPIAGEPTRHVLRECTSCFACDYICPYGCNPAELVVQRCHEQYQKEGLPIRARYFSPQDQEVPHPGNPGGAHRSGKDGGVETTVLEGAPARRRFGVSKWFDYRQDEAIIRQFVHSRRDG